MCRIGPTSKLARKYWISLFGMAVEAYAESRFCLPILCRLTFSSPKRQDKTLSQAHPFTSQPVTKPDLDLLSEELAGVTLPDFAHRVTCCA